MEIFKQISPLKAHLKRARMHGKTVGLVPTMGALHQGHLALIQAAKQRNDITVCSIFVNPAQFNNAGDLHKYPRTPDKDIELLKEVLCDVVFLPEIEELYPHKPTLSFDFGHLDKVMEGKFRPGHFSGVGLVVSKLFNIVQPDDAYFGQKDWQQFSIIRQMAEELNFNINLHDVPTLRENDGLALSSRNQRLNADQRKQAVVFYNALKSAKEKLLNGETVAAVRASVKQMVEQQGIRLEYFEVAESKNLKLLENVDDAKRPIMCIAGFVDEVRLIDNMFLK